MAEQNIGKLALLLTADSKPLENALDRTITKFGKMGNVIRGAGLGLGLGALGAGGGVGVEGAINKVLAGMSAMPGTVGVAAGALTILKESFESLRDSILDVGKEWYKIAKLGKTVGASPSEMKALLIAGRGEDEGVAAGLRHLQEKIGAAAGGSEKDRQDFRDLGTTWEELIQKSPSSQLGEVADKINALNTAAERSSAMKDVFKKAWVDMADIVRRGGKGIEAGFETVIERDLMSDKVIERTKMMKDATRNYGFVWEGVKAKIAEASDFYLLFQMSHMKTMKSIVDQTIFGSQKSAEQVKKDAKEMAAALDEAARKTGLATINKTKIEEARKAGKATTDAWVKELEKLQAETRTPIEQFQDSISNLFKVGFGEEEMPWFARALSGISDKAIKAAGISGPSAYPAGLERGTAAERTFNLQADRADMENNKTQTQLLREALERLESIDEKTGQSAKELADAFKLNKVNF